MMGCIARSGILVGHQHPSLVVPDHHHHDEDEDDHDDDIDDDDDDYYDDDNEGWIPGNSGSWKSVHPARQHHL